MDLNKLAEKLGCCIVIGVKPVTAGVRSTQFYQIALESVVSETFFDRRCDCTSAGYSINRALHELVENIKGTKLINISNLKTITLPKNLRLSFLPFYRREVS